ncbi:type VI secretion system Vgr family protein [Chromobacterium violaceum]|uniref:type VI secretion system Vgr family protein n=4 Tax=Chromobacterium violaceum TaxID=536 RepID=UPI001952808D|nr:type VI secretion system Vgr family protein [Chromobacterium violaceum]QRO31244.1 type VI secretion system tip protein VgrG [Chromobacterium violaceum]QRQ18955.1 type VI secretion system tip protein VgrG [Chromobacterium violaceum]
MDLSSLLASFASAFNQDQRLLTLELGSGQVAAEQLLPQSLNGEEGVSQAYRYQLTCLSPDGAIELKTLLGQAARIGIADAQGQETIRCGVVSQARLMGSDGGFAQYGLTIEPPIALLRHRKTSRVFQDLSVPDIVQQIVHEHQAANPVFARAQTVEFKVATAQPRSYCLQYREDDFSFIVRLLHEEGYAWRFEHLDGDSPQVKLVVFDDAYSLPPAEVERVRFHRSDATEEEDGLTDWSAARQIVPGNVALATFDYQPVSTQHTGDSSQIDQGPGGQALQSSLQDYDPQGLYYAGDAEQLSHYARLRQQAHDLQAKTFEGAGSIRGLTAGQWFRLDDHPAHEADSHEQREFVVTGQTLQVRNNLPADLKAILPTGDKADAPFTTRIQAQRRGIPLTPAYAGTASAKPTSLGVQTATVVGPAGEEVHTDAQGRIKVQFHWQRPDEHPTIGAGLDDKSSCWLRVAMPSAGAGWGHQFIPRLGQEVLVDFIEGDIDRPVITGVLYNGSHPTPDFSGAGSLPANKTLSGIKSKEHQGGGYNELLFDDTPGEVRAKLSSEPGKTQLNQGFLAHPRSNGKAQPRGDGFELRTDHHGAIRAAHGLLLTTEAQNGASGKQLAREHAQSQLDAALSLSQALAETATGQLADTMETGPDEIGPDNAKAGKKTDGHLQHHVDALKAWEAGSNTDKDGKTAKDQAGQQPLLVLSAPAGIASLTEQSQTVTAGTNLNLIAQRDANHTTGRRWLHNVGQHISLFVAGVKDKVALKLIAAKGKVQVQAQSDAMELTADKDVTITSVKQKIHLNGKQEILLTSGGAYVRIKDGKIELHAPGTVSFKGASHDWSGGTSLGQTYNAMPQTKFDDRFQLVDQRTGKPLANHKYEIHREFGGVEKGVTDRSGFTHFIKNPDSPEIVGVRAVFD